MSTSDISRTVYVGICLISFKVSGVNLSSTIGGKGSGGYDDLNKNAGGFDVNREGFDEIKNHLTNNVDGMSYEPNKIMLEKIDNMLANNQKLTGAYEDFYYHELSELNFMKQGYSYELAHQMALELYNVPPQALYSPEVIESLPKWFNKSDFNYWNIER